VSLSVEPPPVAVRGGSWRAAKQFVRGTHRCVAPEETLDRVRPLLRRCGVTRLADITGLDRLGLCTTIAYRPNSATLASGSGKGFTRVAALVSGAMEAIEIDHAERITGPTVRASFAELEQAGVAIPRHGLRMSRHALFDPTRADYWHAGWDLIGQREVYVPHNAVSMLRHPDERARYPLALANDSNGLASGNHLLEAISAGLLELIERDAVSCYRIAEFRTGETPPRVALADSEMPLVQDLIGMLRAAELEPVLMDCTVDTEVPVYVAYLIDQRTRHRGIASGFGAHLDPEIAMIRALTEAAQSRLIYIAGARDDMFRHDDAYFRGHDTADAASQMTGVAPTVEPGGRRSLATASFEGDIAVLIDKLAAVGIEQVILVDLTRDDVGVPVVRIVVPGLEGYASPQFAAGARATAFCQSRLGGALA
jgi:ribosomal protein S12 methylthiotransferase accessory factor